MRWRFGRLFNDVYVSAFETILFIEKVFGPKLRAHAIRISQERYSLRQEALTTSFQSKGIYPPKRAGSSDSERVPPPHALAQQHPP